MAVKEGEVLGYREGTNLQDSFDGLQLDHIPSKQAIKEAFANVSNEFDTVQGIDRNTRRNIDKETTILARANESHSQSDTTGARNKLLAVVDSNVLALASVRDLEKYERIELGRGELSSVEISTAVNNVHARNIDLELYSQREVNIATEFAQEFSQIDVRNNKEHITTFEEIADRYDARLTETNTPKIFSSDFIENRLAKPSIIVGATLASMVFTEKAEASSIPTLHLSANLHKDTFDDLSTNEKLGAELGAGFNALNAVQAGEEFRTGASKSASTLLDTNAYKQGLEQATDAWKPSMTKEVVTLGAMDTAKVAGQSFLKKLPLIGLGAGLVFGVSRAMDGDWKGAGMEVASGAMSLVPGWGTAGSVAMDMALLEKDTHLVSHGVDKLLHKEEEQETPVQSEDNHTTIEPSQEDTLEYADNGMVILGDEYTVSIDDIELAEVEPFDSLAKAQEIALSVYDPANDNVNSNDMGREID